MEKMDSHNSENPIITFLFGASASLIGYMIENGVIEFGIDLLKGCLIGFAGGVCSIIGKNWWENRKKK